MKKEEKNGSGGDSTSHFISVSQSLTLSDWTSLFSVNELPRICSLKDSPGPFVPGGSH